eukprot:14605795-Alexandrium_andersonii.AAC.1
MEAAESVYQIAQFIKWKRDVLPAGDWKRRRQNSGPSSSSSEPPQVSQAAMAIDVYSSDEEFPPRESGVRTI